MTFAFDLISDLHVETWDDFDWEHQATSPFCVVAGDVAREHDRLFKVLRHLGQQYQHVFYIDGNEEHKEFLDDIFDSYKRIQAGCSRIPNVTYLHNNVVIVKGVALLATNGWWTYDFDPKQPQEKVKRWVQDKLPASRKYVDMVGQIACTDAEYLAHSVGKLQTYPDVRQIVVITHTVPLKQLIDHDPDLIDTPRMNIIGNSQMARVLDKDSEKKVRFWCCGHYHNDVDRMIDGVRYIGNCRGRGKSKFSKEAYFPRRIEVPLV